MHMQILTVHSQYDAFVRERTRCISLSAAENVFGASTLAIDRCYDVWGWMHGKVVFPVMQVILCSVTDNDLAFCPPVFSFKLRQIHMPLPMNRLLHPMPPTLPMSLSRPLRTIPSRHSSTQSRVRLAQDAAPVDPASTNGHRTVRHLAPRASLM